MKTLFDIGTVNEAGSEHSLLLEIGNGYCSQAIWNRQANKIDRIRIDSFDELELEQHLPVILQPLQEKAFQTVAVCSAFPQALLFPHKYFKSDYSALDVIYEQPAQAYFHDSIPEWQMVNAYSLPQPVCRLIEEAFPSVSYFHSYTPAIKIYNGFVADNQLAVHFTEKNFRVLLKKDMHIHLAQTYAYKTPLDVIYYLLKICYEFNLSQQEVFLIISGLVDKQSNLLTDLQQYFTQINFAQQPGITLPQSNLPHYYFTSIYNLAACVS